MDAGKRTINDIFNGNRILEIPFFQRSYVWDTPQWERLLEDMKAVSSSNKPYFLGSVILKQKHQPTTNNVGDVRTVIDGQQRLTTLNIFFKVLCLKADQQQVFNRVFQLINDDVALKHNHNDVEAFDQILSLKQIDDLKGEDNITKAYNYFKDNINPSDFNIANILSCILFVGIDLSEHDNEQQIFDTINSLGVKLTTAELLKNYFFNRNEIAHYNDYWKGVFEKDDDTKAYWDKIITTGRLRRTFIDLFFYSYLQIKIQDPGLKVKSDDKQEFAKIDSMFESYKSLIDKYGLDKKAILGEIQDYAVLFKNNFDYDIINEELTNKYGIERINAIVFGLETSTLIPYILFVLKNVNDETVKTELFEILESYIMRRMLVHATTKNYNQLFTDSLISNRILSKKQFLDYINKKTDKINYFPSNRELREGFKSTILVNKQAAGIIYFIESMIRNRNRHATQLLGVADYSLEHLMPKKWENHWSKVNSASDREARNRKLLTLGNLAIITHSLNASIRDSDWVTKKNGKQSKPGLVHYSAGIETLSPFLSLDSWDESEIENRAEFLFEKAISIWKI